MKSFENYNIQDLAIIVGTLKAALGYPVDKARIQKSSLKVLIKQFEELRPRWEEHLKSHS
jgi:hypothetical protein